MAAREDEEDPEEERIDEDETSAEGFIGWYRPAEVFEDRNYAAASTGCQLLHLHRLHFLRRFQRMAFEKRERENEIDF